MSNEASDFLFSGGSRAAKFDNIGDTVEGRITDATVSQQTDMETNQPLTWADGSPRMQLVVTLQTDSHVDGDDDGTRRVFAKGGKYEVAEGSGTSLKDAIADAVKKAGARSLDAGGTLKVGFTGLGKKTNRGFSAPKLYRATYTAPVASVGAEELWGDS